MKHRIICVLVAALLASPGVLGAVTEADFQARTTQSIINLCTASADDPMVREAVNFCQGYLLGAYHYYAAESYGPDGTKMVCFPDPPPTRNAAVSMFIEWAKAHPQYMSEFPVETEFRFLTEKWPCKP